MIEFNEPTPKCIGRSLLLVWPYFPLPQLGLYFVTRIDKPLEGISHTFCHTAAETVPVPKLSPRLASVK